MYTTFFGLKENPFNLTPDPRYLYLSRYHREALDHLLYGINERKGFIAITGGVGTGKTTLCRALLNRLDQTTKSALIFSSFVSDLELLRAINQEFGIGEGSGEETKKECIDVLNRFLLETFRKGGNALLLIDEAQNLTHGLLEQIRMLSNLETEKEKLIQIVLVGQSELKTLLASPSLRQLNDRITVRYNLRPLDANDIRGYVEHRLSIAGGAGAVRFTDGAFKKIFTYSAGNPRRINAVSDRALLIAYSAEKHTVTNSIIAKAVTDLFGESEMAPTKRNRPLRRKLSLAVLIVFLFAAVGMAAWNFREPLSGVLRYRSSSFGPDSPHPVADALMLDRKASLAGLLEIFFSNSERNGDSGDQANIRLASVHMAPEYFPMLKKPFRVTITPRRGEVPIRDRYLLIQEVKPDGALALDIEGKLIPVTREFILEHWGGEVSWVYPEGTGNPLKMGMSSAKVRSIQEKLIQLGYLMKITGEYDKQTSEEVKRFQEDFGLTADGVCGPQTMALLYQMWDE